jgi:hypothetical protein
LKTITGIQGIRFNPLNPFQAPEGLYPKSHGIDLYPIKQGIKHLISACY